MKRNNKDLKKDANPLKNVNKDSILYQLMCEYYSLTKS